MKIKHTFRGSKGFNGYGYLAFIDGETNELVIGENWPHEGGETFRGTYARAVSTGVLVTLTKEAETLARAIEEYYRTHLYENNEVELSCLKFGDSFLHNNHKYMIIDLNISACFISSCGEESSIICAVNLDTYKVNCFSKQLMVNPIVEDKKSI